MGAGGDASNVARQRFGHKAKLTQVKEDLTCLKSMWFNKVDSIIKARQSCIYSSTMSISRRMLIRSVAGTFRVRMEITRPAGNQTLKIRTRQDEKSICLRWALLYRCGARIMQHAWSLSMDPKLMPVRVPASQACLCHALKSQVQQVSKDEIDKTSRIRASLRRASPDFHHSHSTYSEPLYTTE